MLISCLLRAHGSHANFRRQLCFQLPPNLSHAHGAAGLSAFYFLNGFDICASQLQARGKFSTLVACSCTTKLERKILIDFSGS